MFKLFRYSCVLLSVLGFGLSELTLAAVPTPIPLLLHDFERASGTPNLGGAMNGWSADPGRQTPGLQPARVAHPAGAGGRARVLR